MKDTNIDCGGWGYLHTERESEAGNCSLMRNDSNDSENGRMEQTGEGTLFAAIAQYGEADGSIGELT